MIDITCEGLDGEGYSRNQQGDLVHYYKAETLRAAFGQVGKRPVLITLYPGV